MIVEFYDNYINDKLLLYDGVKVFYTIMIIKLIIIHKFTNQLINCRIYSKPNFFPKLHLLSPIFSQTTHVFG